MAHSLSLMCCGEVTQPSVARLPNLWRDYLWRGYLVARLPATMTEAHLNNIARYWQWYTKSDILSIYQVTVQYFVGISIISTPLWFQ